MGLDCSILARIPIVISSWKGVANRKGGKWMRGEPMAGIYAGSGEQSEAIGDKGELEVMQLSRRSGLGTEVVLWRGGLGCESGEGTVGLVLGFTGSEARLSVGLRQRLLVFRGAGTEGWYLEGRVGQRASGRRERQERVPHQTGRRRLNGLKKKVEEPRRAEHSRGGTRGERSKRMDCGACT